MSRTIVRWSLIGMAVVVAGVVAFGLIDGWFDPLAPSDQKLSKALTGVDRIRVRTGGTCHREVESERTLFEETDPTTIAKIVQFIHIDDRKKQFKCACCGDPSIEFYRGEELVVTLGYHHGRSVRWPEGWRGDGLLTADSAAKIKEWMVSHGVKSKYGEF